MFRFASSKWASTLYLPVALLLSGSLFGFLGGVRIGGLTPRSGIIKLARLMDRRLLGGRLFARSGNEHIPRGVLPSR
jgi:hypothetical protein